MSLSTGMGLRGVIGNLGVAALGVHATRDAVLSALSKSEVSEGRWAAICRSYSAEDLAIFGRLTGDLNPIHLDRRFAASSHSPLSDSKSPSEATDPRAVHGLLFSSLFPALFANCVPASVYVSQTLRFRTPLRADQEVIASISVKRVRRGLALVKTEARLGDASLLSGDGMGVPKTLDMDLQGPVVVDGEATVLLPEADVALEALQHARRNAGLGVVE